MNCKHCNAEMEEGLELCPACGAAQAEPVTESVAEEAPAVEAPAAEEPRAKLSTGKIVLLVILAVAALAVIAALIMGGKGGTAPAETTMPSVPAVSAPGASVPAETVPMTIPADGNPEDVTCKGSYTVTDDQIVALADTIVATMGETKLTNSELQVYYWMQLYDFLGQYGSYASMFGMDVTKPLDMQLSIDGEHTWQQYFLQGALDTWINYQAMAHEAAAAGFELDEEYAGYLEELPESLAMSAAEAGYESTEAMLQRDMGAGATMEGYMNYLYTYYNGFMYYGDTMEAIAFTDAEVEAYFDAHAEEYLQNGLEKTDERYVDVRHILISPESAEGATTYTDAEWAAAEAKANDVLNEWLTKNPDEDGFSVLAEAYSMDPGSASNGGLYEDVYMGQMVAPFEEWCFDAARQPGDYGIVKTDYGYHIMYFVGSDYVWYLTAENDLMVDKGNEFLQSVRDKNPAVIDYSAIALANVSLIEG